MRLNDIWFSFGDTHSLGEIYISRMPFNTGLRRPIIYHYQTSLAKNYLRLYALLAAVYDIVDTQGIKSSVMFEMKLDVLSQMSMAAKLKFWDEYEIPS